MRRSWSRAANVAVAAIVAAAIPACGRSGAAGSIQTTDPSGSVTVSRGGLPGTDTAYIAVSVATVWTRPGPKRPVDAPALSNPAHPRQWVNDMTVAQKKWLSATGAVQTQALYATKVYVLDTSGIWTEIAVSTQPSPKNDLGYPGWVPTRQLTTQAPAHTPRFAVVKARSAWLWSAWSHAGVAGRRIVELSYDTHLPVVTVAPNYVEVVDLLGQHRAVRRSLVVIHTVGDPWRPTGAGIVAESKTFLGLAYLWGGSSGFGYDCSGLTYSLYSRAGFRLPRDADVQATHGRPVPVSQVRPGDLLFVADSGGIIVHVVMYVGLVAGRRSVIESPYTGASVRIVALSSYHYAAVRRYLG